MDRNTYVTQYARLTFLKTCGLSRVDIMVQPSWTWGPVGPLEFDTDSFRAVENGFTMLRCSSVGVSGVVTPFYRVLEYRFVLFLVDAHQNIASPCPRHAVG